MVTLRKRRHILGTSVARADADNLLSKINSLSDVSLDAALAVLADYNCGKNPVCLARATRDWSPSSPLRLPNAHEALRQAVVMAEDFSYLVADTHAVDSATPHLRADHPWQTPVSYGMDTFLAFRLAPHGFLCVNLRNTQK